MSIVWAPPGESHRHECNAPMRDQMITIPGTTRQHKIGVVPSSPFGTVWQCDVCGRMWTVRYDDGIRLYGYTPSCHYWSPATWWERRKARRAAR